MTSPTFVLSVPIGAWHPFLPACLESLVRQTPAPRIALLDASGDDRVRTLADRFADRLAYRRHGPDAGQAAAIAEGWAAVEGDILGWLNADDLLFPNALAAATAALETGRGFDVVYGHSTMLDAQGWTTSYHWGVEPPSEGLLQRAIVSQPSCFARRAAVEAAGGLDAGLHYTMDWDLWIRLMTSGARFGFVDDALSMVLADEGTKTAQFNAARRAEIRRILERYAPAANRAGLFRAFAIQNALDRLRPVWLKGLVARALVRGGKVVHGLSADGAIANEARLPLAHFDAAPKRFVVVELDRPDRLVSAQANGASLAATTEGRTKRFELERPLVAGERLDVALRAQPGGARLLRCGLK